MGPDGALWFTEFKGSKIGRIVPPAPLPPARLYTVAPCRVVDTRNPTGPFGGPALQAGTDRLFDFSGRCGVPSSARAVVVNVAVTQPSSGGNLTAYPADASLPLVSIINYAAGHTRANNGILPLASGAMLIRCSQPSGAVQLILDVTGYFSRKGRAAPGHAWSRRGAKGSWELCTFARLTPSGSDWDRPLRADS